MEQTQNTNINEWIKTEIEEAKKNTISGERLPALTLEEGKLTTFVVDASKPFEKWTDLNDNTVKKIIPVTHEGVKKNFWLNTKNPLYSKMLDLILGGKTEFKILRTGKLKETKYNLVD